MRALLNDAFQRLVTFNKLEQRRHLLERLDALRLPPGSKALDFGCGTGLFAPTFERANLRYHGYDIDEALVVYARRLYRRVVFVSTPEALRALGPFDVIVANCCFHHISDETLAGELAGMRELLRDDGTFIMIDLLLHDNDPSFLRRQYRKLERGAFVRRGDEYGRLIERSFRVKRRDHDRSHVWSVKHNPLHQDLIVFECGK